MSHTFRSEFRWFEISTPASYHNYLFRVLDHARDCYFREFPLPGHSLPIWVIRATDLQLKTAKVPGPLTNYAIETKVTKVGRTSCVFEQQIKLESKGVSTLLAVATATVILIDSSSPRDIRSVPVPDTIHVLPSTSELFKPRPPSLIDVPETAFCYTAYVRHSDCDGLGHVTNSSYVDFWHDALAKGRFFGVFEHEDGDIEGLEAVFERDVKSQTHVNVWIWFDAVDTVYTIMLKKKDGTVAAKGRMWARKREAFQSKL